MARLLIDDGFVHHPKVVGLTPRDRWTWLELLCYCARYRTGGHVPSSIREVVRGADGAFIARVFERGLLDEDVAGDGWKVHDWTIYNGSSVEKRVKAYLESHPESTANEVARDVAGRREVVLSEVARIRQTSGNSGSEGGSGEPDGNSGGTGSAGGSLEVPPHARVLPLPWEPLGVKPSGGSKGSGPSEPHATPQRAASRAPRCPDCEVGGGLHAADCPRAPKS